MNYRNLIVVVLFFSASVVSAQTTDSVNIVPDNILLQIDTNDIISAIAETNIIIDTNANKPKIHSPKKAGWLSTALPGLGQIYNKKYWKLPIIYGGFAGLGTGIYLNAREFIILRDEYRNRLNGKTELLKEDLLRDYSNIENLKATKLLYQRNMELFIIVTAVFYLANIIDAIVDAHLMSFDVSDNLSMNILPSIGFNTQLTAFSKPISTVNITLILNF